MDLCHVIQPRERVNVSCSRRRAGHKGARNHKITTGIPIALLRNECINYAFLESKVARLGLAILTKYKRA